MSTRSSRRSIHRAGNGRLSDMVGPPKQASPSTERRLSSLLSVRSANCSGPSESAANARQLAHGSCQEPNNALAIRQVKAHCRATTEPPLASIGDVDAICAPAQPRSGASNMSAHRSPGQSSTFEYRLAQEAVSLRLQAKGMPVGIRRTELLRKARQIDVAGEINEWLTSPGLRAPS